MTHPHTRQRGSTLIISLLILIVMTLIGLTGMSTSNLEEKMAGNTRDQALAFQAAEAALRDGEEYYNSVIISPAAAFDGTNAGLYPTGNHPDPFAAGTWTNSRAYSGVIDGVKKQPSYIIELIGKIGDATTDLNVSGYGESTGLGNVLAARITARGVGGTENTAAILQTNYGKRF